LISALRWSASAVFRELADRTPAYANLRYPALKDETQPVQVSHAIAPARDLTHELESVRRAVEELSDDGERSGMTPPIGHELFKLGTLTEKVPQFHLFGRGQIQSLKRFGSRHSTRSRSMKS